MTRRPPPLHGKTAAHTARTAVKEDRPVDTVHAATSPRAPVARGRGCLAAERRFCLDGVVPTIRIVFPTSWDRKQLAARPDVWRGVYDVVFEAPRDEDCPDTFDVLGFVDRAVAQWPGSVDGVFSGSDYPGASVAAAIGSALGLPASPPAAIMGAAHKGLSRAMQARTAPAETPAFVQIDPDAFDAAALPLPYPCFVKPAKGCFSVLARRVADPGELTAFLHSEAVRTYRHDFLRVYRALVARYLGPEVDAGAFVAEALIGGRMATVEGFVGGDEALPLGVVDSVLHPRTRSFVAFEYPSTLPGPVQARMVEVSCTLARALGLRWTMFNVEWMWDEVAERLHLVEINPRMCGQFADLYEKVDGVHGHRVAFDLACGRPPRLRARAGTFACAASFPLRTFEPVRVERAPSQADVDAAMRLFPDTLVWNEVATGADLSDFVTGEDGASCRYGIVNLGAPDRATLRARLAAVEERLGYAFTPLQRG